MLKVGDAALISLGSGVLVGGRVGSEVGVLVTGSVIPGVGVSLGAKVAVMVYVGVGVRNGTWVWDAPQALMEMIRIIPE